MCKTVINVIVQADILTSMIYASMMLMENTFNAVTYVIKLWICLCFDFDRF
jgi:hypothetical protein